MRQSRFASFMEANANVVVGYPVTHVVYVYVCPLFGWHFSHAQAFGVIVLFSTVSLVRSYVIRRFFEWRTMRKSQG